MTIHYHQPGDKLDPKAARCGIPRPVHLTPNAELVDCLECVRLIESETTQRTEVPRG